MGLIRDASSAHGRSYSQLRHSFEQLRLLYSPKAALSAKELGMDHGESRTWIELANLAQLGCWLADGTPASLSEADQHFLTMFGCQGSDLPPVMTELHLGIMTQRAVESLAAKEPEKPPQEVLGEVLLSGLEDRLREQHGGDELTSADQDFVSAVHSRKEILQGEVEGQAEPSEWTRTDVSRFARLTAGIATLRDKHPLAYLLRTFVSCVKSRLRSETELCSRFDMSIEPGDEEPATAQGATDPGDDVEIDFDELSSFFEKTATGLVQNALAGLAEDADGAAKPLDEGGGASTEAANGEPKADKAPGLANGKTDLMTDYKELEALVAESTSNYVKTTLHGLSPMPYQPTVPQSTSEPRTPSPCPERDDEAGVLTLRSREHGGPDAVPVSAAAAPGPAFVLRDVLAAGAGIAVVAGRQPAAEPDLPQRHPLRQGAAGGPVQVVDAHEARGRALDAAAVDAGGGKGAHGRAGHGQGPALEPDPDAVWAQRHHLGHPQGPHAGAAQGQGAQSQALLPQDQLGDALLPPGRHGRAQDEGADAGGAQGGRGAGAAHVGRGPGEAAGHHGPGGRAAAPAAGEGGGGGGDGGFGGSNPGGECCPAGARRGDHGAPDQQRGGGAEAGGGGASGEQTAAGDDAAGSPSHASGAPPAAVSTAAAADAAGEPASAAGATPAEADTDADASPSYASPSARATGPSLVRGPWPCISRELLSPSLDSCLGLGSDVGLDADPGRGPCSRRSPGGRCGPRSSSSRRLSVPSVHTPHRRHRTAPASADPSRPEPATSSRSAASTTAALPGHDRSDDKAWSNKAIRGAETTAAAVAAATAESGSQLPHTATIAASGKGTCPTIAATEPRSAASSAQASTRSRRHCAASTGGQVSVSTPDAALSHAGGVIELAGGDTRRRRRKGCLARGAPGVRSTEPGVGSRGRTDAMLMPCSFFSSPPSGVLPCRTTAEAFSAALRRPTWRGHEREWKGFPVCGHDKAFCSRVHQRDLAQTGVDSTL